MSRRNIKQYGAVSLFIVVFTALLITVVTISFVKIMTKDQQQATATDLSQSAYDSAEAGVEDAKRALIKYRNVCANGGDCAAATKAISSLECNDAVSILGDVASNESNGEIKVQTGDSNSLDQAYTCLKITLNTDDYAGILDKDGSKIIPISGVSDFDRIKIEWFSAKDLSSLDQAVTLTTGAGTPLLSQSVWALNQPSIIRAQLIQYKTSGFSLSDFDNLSDKGSNNTLFLYPSKLTLTNVPNFSDNNRKTATVTPTLATCVDIKTTPQTYACSMTIRLPKPVVSADHEQFLNLTSLYKSAHFRVTLSDENGKSVKFNGVQPLIDSTGRANDLFRRVQARVETADSDFPYPQAAVDISGSFCKNFIITDDVNDYFSGATGTNACTP